jgi:putative SOS response-associated peptidase YedK
MCGRYTMFTEPEALQERFHTVLPPGMVGATYNAAPSQAQLTILNENPQTIVRAAWGFVPAWADGKPEVKPLINARAETVATKPFFRAAFKKQRCLVLADGFYEWRRTKEGKRPYRIVLKTEEPFAFAGLWSRVHNAAGEPHATFAIITTEANELVAQIHNRMPVILQKEDEEHWLDTGLSTEAAQALLAPFPADLLMAYAVSAKVNSPANDAPDLVMRTADITLSDSGRLGVMQWPEPGLKLNFG